MGDLIEEHVMECGCGDLRPLEQMFLRCTGGGPQVFNWVVECIDCTISATDEDLDIDALPTMEEAWRARGCRYGASRREEGGRANARRPHLGRDAGMKGLTLPAAIGAALALAFAAALLTLHP